MIAAELGSTGAEEISVFHELLLVKGTNPPRLALCPAFMTLQARLPPPVPLPIPVPPPPRPEFLLLLLETLEQATKLSVIKKYAATAREHDKADRGERIDKHCQTHWQRPKEAFRTCPDSQAQDELQPEV